MEGDKINRREALGGLASRFINCVFPREARAGEATVVITGEITERKTLIGEEGIQFAVGIAELRDGKPAGEGGFSYGQILDDGAVLTVFNAGEYILVDNSH